MNDLFSDDLLFRDRCVLILIPENYLHLSDEKRRRDGPYFTAGRFSSVAHMRGTI